MKYEIDIYKQFKLPTPVCGLVMRITSPKGLRKKERNGQYSYQFQTELMPIIYEGAPMTLQAGIYQVLDIARINGGVQWNHYLFIVDLDGSTYPIAEYLNDSGSTWVKDSLPLVKDYFNGQPIDPIQLTRHKTPVQRSTWGRH